MTVFGVCRNRHFASTGFCVHDDTRWTCQLEEHLSKLEGILGMESAFLLLAEPAQFRGVREVLLNLRSLLFGGEGASGEGDFERFA
jgi:hypothetical protein